MSDKVDFKEKNNTRGSSNSDKETRCHQEDLMILITWVPKNRA